MVPTKLKAANLLITRALFHFKHFDLAYLASLSSLSDHLISLNAA